MLRALYALYLCLVKLNRLLCIQLDWPALLACWEWATWRRGDWGRWSVVPVVTFIQSLQIQFVELVRRHVGKAAPQPVLEHVSRHLAHTQGLNKPLFRGEFSEGFYIDLVSAPLVFVHSPKSSISSPIPLPLAPVFAKIKA